MESTLEVSEMINTTTFITSTNTLILNDLRCSRAEVTITVYFLIIVPSFLASVESEKCGLVLDASSSVQSIFHITRQRLVGQNVECRPAKVYS